MSTKVIGLDKHKYAALGKQVRNALDGNLLVGSFAAEMVGESYPFPKSMWDVVFSGFTDEELGHRFVKWSDGR